METDPQEKPVTKEDLMGQPVSREDAEFIADLVEKCSKKLQEAQAEIATEIWGQDPVIKLTIACMVAGGHFLAEGPPGLAKSRLVSRVAKVMGLSSKRVQFTPDLMPSDITGSEIQKQNEQGKYLEFVKGPLFTQFFMADEINRASPRTQSALLEAMQDKRVTAVGETRSLQRPFTVMATQNPIENEGVYPLPEAQIDRFMMKVDFGYTDYKSEKKMLYETTGTDADLREMCTRDARGEDLTNEPDQDEQSRVRTILGKNDLVIMQKLARRLPLSEGVADAILKIVRNSRPTEDNPSEFVRKNVLWGPGPRATINFGLAVKALALIDGRTAPNIGDVEAVADTILQHRLILSFNAKADNKTYQDVKEEVFRGLKLNPKPPKP